MRKSVIYTLLAISLFAMLGTGCSKKAEQKSETTKSAAQTESVGESIGDQTADTEKMTESETEKKKETKTTPEFYVSKSSHPNFDHYEIVYSGYYTTKYF